MEIKSLLLQNTTEKIESILCICEKNDINLDLIKILSQYELNKYSAFISESSRKQFLLGRISAKYAYTKMIGRDIPFHLIDVKNGVLEHPVLNNAYCGLTISHTNNIATSLVFDRRFPMRIDVEKIDLVRNLAL